MIYFLPALDGALEQFTAMREREGAALKADILKKCAVLRELNRKNRREGRCCSGRIQTEA